jgi:integration host factor subunit alpha
MALNKTEVIQIVSQKVGLDKKKSIHAVEELLNIVKSTLASGEDVSISGFGKFYLSEKAIRKGRNPATGDTMMLRRRRIARFKCSQKLRRKLNCSNDL